MMYAIKDIVIKTTREGNFFDLFDKDNFILGTDYLCLDKEIMIESYSGEIKNWKNKETYAGRSIKDLRIIFDNLLLAAYQIYDEYNLYIDAGKQNKALLVNQLIFDILFDKYLRMSEKMTKNHYSEMISNNKYSLIR